MEFENPNQRSLSGFPGKGTGMVCAITIAIAVSACMDAGQPAGPADRPQLAIASSVATDPAPDQMAVAAVVPGFGGYFIDANGAPTVWLTDPTARPAAEQALAAFLADRGWTATDLRVRQGSFSYAQLDGWYRQARPSLFTVAGMILGDVDEANNRIRLGVSSGIAAATVQSILATLGVPASAVTVQQRSPIRALAALTDEVRPLQGGLQINFLHVAGVRTVSLICTLGFNAISNGVSSYITNSHCSQVEGGEETPTEYYQPLMDPDGDQFVNPENLIAIEADDPHWFISLDCPLSPAFQCRWSDASRAAYTPTAADEAKLGRIARTNRQSTSLTDIVLDIDGFFRIRAEQPRGVVGEVAHKVGRTTGWTSGVTTETCVDVIALGTTHMRLCQEFVNGVSDSGDSGSPVFRRRGGSNVVLLGVLWGGSVDEANPEFVYSPMFGIERELGPLQTF